MRHCCKQTISGALPRWILWAPPHTPQGVSGRHAGPIYTKLETVLFIYIYIYFHVFVVKLDALKAIIHFPINNTNIVNDHICKSLRESKTPEVGVDPTLRLTHSWGLIQEAVHIYIYTCIFIFVFSMYCMYHHARSPSERGTPRGSPRQKKCTWYYTLCIFPTI